MCVQNCTKRCTSTFTWVAFVYELSMHRSAQYDSVKNEIEVVLYAALECASKVLS